MGATRIPTSNAKPYGPKTDPSEDDIRRAAAYADPLTQSAQFLGDTRPVLRTRFDQFANPAVTPDDLDSEKPPTEQRVAGQAFFITNCEPLYFWDFPRAVWAALGHVPSYTICLPRSVGLALASAAEVWSKLTGREAGFTVYRVKYSTQNRYYNMERARRVLGYEPIVGIHDGIIKTVDVSLALFLLSAYSP